MLSEDLRDRAREAGLKVATWVVDDPEELASLARFELYGIGCNRPGVLLEALRDAVDLRLPSAAAARPAIVATPARGGRPRPSLALPWRRMDDEAGRQLGVEERALGGHRLPASATSTICAHGRRRA